jgi:hypothetical protein
MTQNSTKGNKLFRKSHLLFHTQGLSLKKKSLPEEGVSRKQSLKNIARFIFLFSSSSASLRHI